MYVTGILTTNQREQITYRMYRPPQRIDHAGWKKIYKKDRVSHDPTYHELLRCRPNQSWSYTRHSGGRDRIIVISRLARATYENGISEQANPQRQKHGRLPEARDEPRIGDQLQGTEGQSEGMIFKTRLCGDYTIHLKQINLTVQKLYLNFKKSTHPSSEP